LSSSKPGVAACGRSLAFTYGIVVYAPFDNKSRIWSVFDISAKLVGMKLARAHFTSLAWMLVAAVLLNGLACSFGHGIMHGQTYRLPSPHETTVEMDHHVHHHAMTAAPDTHQGSMPMVDSSHDSAIKQLAMSDCAFAGTLPLALMVFTALSWLLRHKRQRLYHLDAGCRRPPRDAFPCLNPRAP